MRKVESKSLKIVVLLVLMFSLLLTFMFSANWVSESALAIEEPKLEVKTYNKTTLKDDFYDDKVIIVLSKDVTRQFIAYTPNDFCPDINIVGVIVRVIVKTYSQKYKFIIYNYNMESL